MSDKWVEYEDELMNIMLEAGLKAIWGKYETLRSDQIKLFDKAFPGLLDNKAPIWSQMTDSKADDYLRNLRNAYRIAMRTIEKNVQKIIDNNITKEMGETSAVLMIVMNTPDKGVALRSTPKFPKDGSNVTASAHVGDVLLHYPEESTHIHAKVNHGGGIGYIFLPYIEWKAL